MPGRPWTKSEESRALEMDADGLYDKEIAAVLGRSPDSVSAKLNDLRRQQYADGVSLRLSLGEATRGELESCRARELSEMVRMRWGTGTPGVRPSAKADMVDWLLERQARDAEADASLVRADGRGELAALADRLGAARTSCGYFGRRESQCRGCPADGDPDSCAAAVWKDAARRIREACGEVDG